MAQEYFYSLRDKKRTRILDAIEKCMQTFDYDKLSINDIQFLYKIGVLK